MGQGDVIELLENQNRWLNTKEIAKLLKLGRGSTWVKLRKLRLRNEIISKKEKRKYLYKCKKNG